MYSGKKKIMLQLRNVDLFGSFERNADNHHWSWLINVSSLDCFLRWTRVKMKTIFQKSALWTCSNFGKKIFVSTKIIHSKLKDAQQENPSHWVPAWQPFLLWFFFCLIYIYTHLAPRNFIDRWINWDFSPCQWPWDLERTRDIFSWSEHFYDYCIEWKKVRAHITEVRLYTFHVFNHKRQHQPVKWFFISKLNFEALYIRSRPMQKTSCEGSNYSWASIFEKKNLSSLMKNLILVVQQFSVGRATL